GWRSGGNDVAMGSGDDKQKQSFSAGRCDVISHGLFTTRRRKRSPLTYLKTWSQVAGRILAQPRSRRRTWLPTAVWHPVVDPVSNVRGQRIRINSLRRDRPPNT